MISVRLSDFDHFSESGSIPKSRSRCRRAALALGDCWELMASRGVGEFGGVSGSYWKSLWCVEVEGFDDCDDIAGSFALEGCA